MIHPNSRQAIKSNVIIRKDQAFPLNNALNVMKNTYIKDLTVIHITCVIVVNRLRDDNRIVCLVFDCCDFHHPCIPMLIMNRCSCLSQQIQQQMFGEFFHN